MRSPVILLVDPDDRRRQAHAGELRDTGCEVIALERGGEAVGRQRAGALPTLDLIIAQPVLGGEEIAVLSRARFCCPVLIGGCRPRWPALLRWALQPELRAAG